jgi:hypothetical protein
MPFFNNRPKKHASSCKPEAKAPVILAQRTPSRQLEFTISEVHKSFSAENPHLGVNSQLMGEEAGSLLQSRVCSFFDIPETLKDYEEKYEDNCELLITADSF